MNPITAVLAIALAACAGSLAGCERLQRPTPQTEQAYNGQSTERTLHERTLTQGESGRMSY